jgi:hypothetical protein
MLFAPVSGALGIAEVRDPSQAGLDQVDMLLTRFAHNGATCEWLSRSLYLIGCGLTGCPRLPMFCYVGHVVVVPTVSSERELGCRSGRPRRLIVVRRIFLGESSTLRHRQCGYMCVSLPFSGHHCGHLLCVWARGENHLTVSVSTAAVCYIVTFMGASSWSSISSPSRSHVISSKSSLFFC